MTTQQNGTFLPYGYHTIGDDDIAAVVAALQARFLTGGDYVGAFEEALTSATGARHAVAVSNGTTALHLCAEVLGLGPGDAVIVPSLTFLATANAVRYTGAEVVFADVDAQTGLMTRDTLRGALARVPTNLTANAVFNVHLSGQVASPEEIAAEARERGLAVVEDACHAIGTTYGGKEGLNYAVGRGAHADLTAFSFHPVKSIAMGEGGAVTTNDSDLYKRLQILRNHGIEPTVGIGGAEDTALGLGERYPSHYKMGQLGFNYRVSDINCALGLSQMKKLPAFLERRRNLVEAYDSAIAALPNYIRPAGRVVNCRPGWHLYVALIDFVGIGKPRSSVMKALFELGIGTQVHYYPVHAQPYYRRRYGELLLPGTAEYYNMCLSLPLFPAMTNEDVGRVVDGLEAVVP
jgi:UDP-4-amino-4,6-dideoxy-N-acetyl-beta-L-altrosamine transaminase